MSEFQSRIVIIDDQRLYLELLSDLLGRVPGIELIGTALGEQGLVDLLAQGGIDLVLLDVELPSHSGRDGIALAQMLRAEHPDIKVISMSMNTRSELLRTLLNEVGVHGFIDKNESSTTGLLSAIELVMSGMIYTSAEIMKKVAHVREMSKLSDREYEVLEYLAGGATMTQAAGEMGLAYKTIDNHKQRIFRKLNCHSTTEAIAIFMRHVFLHQDDDGQLPDFKRKRLMKWGRRSEKSDS